MGFWFWVFLFFLVVVGFFWVFLLFEGVLELSIKVGQRG